MSVRLILYVLTSVNSQGLAVGTSWPCSVGKLNGLTQLVAVFALNHNTSHDADACAPGFVEVKAVNLDVGRDGAR